MLAPSELEGTDYLLSSTMRLEDSFLQIFGKCSLTCFCYLKPVKLAGNLLYSLVNEVRQGLLYDLRYRSIIFYDMFLKRNTLATTLRLCYYQRAYAF